MPSNQQKAYGTGTPPVSRSQVCMVSHSPTMSGVRMSTAVNEESVGLIRQAVSGGPRKRELDRGML